MSAGRPTVYSEGMLDKAREYVYGGYEQCGDPVPTIAGLACELDVSRETIYSWAEDERKPEFADIVSRVRRQQERDLVRGSLKGDFNPKIAGMMLAKHGYSEKVQNEHTGKDGGPIEVSDAKERLMQRLKGGDEAG